LEKFTDKVKQELAQDMCKMVEFIVICSREGE